MNTGSQPQGEVQPGSPVYDLAYLSGAGPVPTGSVAFFLCEPPEVVPGVGCPAGSGSQVGAPKAVDAAGNAVSDPAFRYDPGLYCWRAEYSGDANYLPASHTNDTTECFMIVSSP
jgi:hypothetical protein